MRRSVKASTAFMGVWLISTVAMSSGTVVSKMAPEMPFLERVKESAEYPLMKQFQELSLELQMLELVVKNRRDEAVENKIHEAVTGIEGSGSTLGTQFRDLNARQIETVLDVIELARKYGQVVGAAPEQFDIASQKVREGDFHFGPLTVFGKNGTTGQAIELTLLQANPLKIGRSIVWELTLPAEDGANFWSRATKLVHANHKFIKVGPIASEALQKKFAPANAIFSRAKEQASSFHADSYRALYSAFEEHRYGILSRVNLARKTLLDLGRQSGSMGVPEEYAALYNQLLEHLFSYGIDVSVSGSTESRDLAIKGFLFAESPEAAKELLEKLKFSPNLSTYTAPST